MFYRAVPDLVRLDVFLLDVSSRDVTYNSTSESTVMLV